MVQGRLTQFFFIYRYRYVHILPKLCPPLRAAREVQSWPRSIWSHCSVGLNERAAEAHLNQAMGSTRY